MPKRVCKLVLSLIVFSKSFSISLESRINFRLTNAWSATQLNGTISSNAPRGKHGTTRSKAEFWPDLNSEEMTKPYCWCSYSSSLSTNSWRLIALQWEAAKPDCSLEPQPKVLIDVQRFIQYIMASCSPCTWVNTITWFC